MKVIVEPDAGIAPVLAAIRRAKKSIDVMVFRLDRSEVSDALAEAVKRGVAVRALVAHTNRGGESRLRKLERRLLDAGAIVSRTSDELVRYHGKMMIVDRCALNVYGFNFTWLDTKSTRSFGLVTRNRALVEEALKLFEADSAKQPYAAGSKLFVVSPANARERLASFVSSARKQLLIYDPKVSDSKMLGLIAERMRAGVDVRIIGKVTQPALQLSVERHPGKRLHVRAMVRDGRHAFVGSQSLRRLELEKRREVGLITGNVTVVRTIQRIFEEDWAMTPSGKARDHGEETTAQPAGSIQL